MKCLCGFSEKPNNLTKLQSHLKSCINQGKVPRLGEEYFIVWRDGEFVVAGEKKEDEQDYGTELEIKEAPAFVAKIGLPTYTPAESLLSRVKTKRNAFGEEEKKKPKKS